MKKTICFLCVISLIFCFLTPCLATGSDIDINYSGEIEEYREPADSSDATGEEDKKITVTNELFYSQKSDMYYFYADGFSDAFTSNVCNGMITKGPVNIYLPDGVSADLYKDGKLYDGGLTDIQSPGKYTLQVKKNDGIIENVLRFTLIGDYVGFIDEFSVPNGFRIRRASFNGDKIYCGNSFSVEKEGLYTVRYLTADNSREYNIEFTVDRTAPTLALSELKNGKAWGPVSVADLEPGATITVIRDGDTETYSDGKLTKAGNYTLYVRDAALNQTEYRFTIMIYLNWTNLFPLFILILLAAGIVLYFYLSRKKFKVR